MKPGGAWRPLLLVAAALSLGLAAAGVVIPGLPTTPFLLLAAWAAARSSPRLAAWLESHALWGPVLRHWRETRSVSRRAKRTATVMMALCALLLWRVAGSGWLFAGTVCVMLLVLVFLWSRPEPPRTDPPRPV